LVMAACAVDTRFQVAFWRNDMSVFTHCVAVTENNYVAINKVGVNLANEGKLDEAKAAYLKSIEIQPNYVDAIKNMGILLTEQGDTANATNYLYQAIQLEPKLADIWEQLGFALAALGKTDDAIEFYRTAIRLKPESADAWRKLAQALVAKGEMAEAIECYHTAIRLKPDLVPALNNLAWILATQPDARFRNGPEAVGLAAKACALTRSQKAVLVGTLATAYAEAGRFPEAVDTGERARALWQQTAARAADERSKQSAERWVHFNEDLLKLYRAGRPYREETQSPAVPANASR